MTDRPMAYLALFCAILTVVACAAPRQVKTVAPAPSIESPAPDEGIAEAYEFPVADSLLLGVDPERTLEQAVEYYNMAVEAAVLGDTEGVGEAVDRMLQLLAALGHVQNPKLVTLRDELLAGASELHEKMQTAQPAAITRKKGVSRTFNSSVSRQIRWFQKYNRNGIRTAYARSGLYGDMIRRELAARGMPMELQWLPIIESAYTPRVQSHANAVGLWQFVLDTGKRYGLKRTGWTDDRMDPYKATGAALDYLSELHDMFDGDWLLALAAYNCGENRVLRAIKRQRTSDFWKLRLPRETRNYVPRFLAAVYIVENPAQYGFELPEPLPEQVFEEYFIDRSVALADAARALNIPLEHLKNLNASVRYGVTPPEGYAVRVPLGLAGSLHTALGDIPEARFTPPPETLRYRIRNGDTLSHIARRYRTSVGKLKAMNGMRNSRIYAGQWIRVPGKAYDDIAYVVNTKSSETAGTALVMGAVKPQNKPVSIKPASATKYTIKRGDTLFAIAKRYGVRVEDLQQANRTIRSRSLQVGQVITVPTSR